MDNAVSTKRAMIPEEHKYAYYQSPQISMQTGFIGYLRADLGSTGKEFYSSWNDFCEELKTDEFKAEFNTIINNERKQNCPLHDIETLYKFCFADEQAAIDSDKRSFGYRIDTPKYTYLMRYNPYKGEYNLYCHCYKRDLLDKHIHEARRGIRFIDPHYNEKFVIPDGDSIRVTYSNGKSEDSRCRYIDYYHLEVGINLYHICEFAEITERNGNTVIPLRSSLPEQCYVYLPSTDEIVLAKKGVTGYLKTDLNESDADGKKELAERMNEKLGVTKRQAEAMKAGAACGWESPAADPYSYNENGAPIKQTRKSKDYER